ALTLSIRWSRRRGLIDTSPERVRRGTGHAMLGLQEFIQPSVEFVFQAENLEQRKDDDDSPGDEGTPQAIASGLAASLGPTPVVPEEVRRHLAAAQRAGLDWRAFFDQAVSAELAARPYRAPALPPVWRVAPRE